MIENFVIRNLWPLVYLAIGICIVVMDWVYYKRVYSEENMVLVTRTLVVFWWPLIILTAIYLVLFGDLKLEDFKNDN